MTRFVTIIFSCLACFALASCELGGRKYPPGYTDDGVKFSEDDWRFHESTAMVSLWYFGSGSSDPMIFCKKRPSLGQAGIEPTGPLEFRSFRLEAYQQWPQPPISITIGEAEFDDLPTLAPREESTAMTIQANGRIKRRLLTAIEQGDPISFTFAEQSFSVPGVPKSMREAFAAKCRGDFE